MEFSIEKVFDAPPSLIFEAWLNEEKHAAMTGGECRFDDEQFSAWDGYISGRNIELKPGQYIKQYWRTSEFKANQPDSILEITLHKLDEQKTRLILHHSNLLEEDMHYKQGWIDHYFEPMSAYFAQPK